MIRRGVMLLQQVTRMWKPCLPIRNYAEPSNKLTPEDASAKLRKILEVEYEHENNSIKDYLANPVSYFSSLNRMRLLQLDSPKSKVQIVLKLY